MHLEVGHASLLIDAMPDPAPTSPHPAALAALLKTAAAFERLVVLGLQRSGTHVAAEIIAHERGLPLFSERDFNYTACQPGTSRIPIPIEQFIAEHDRFVLQAPALLQNAHELARADVLVIFVRRPAEEVRASRERSGWPGEVAELAKYDQDEYAHLYGPDVDLVDKQLAVFEHVTKPKLPHLVEIDYADLTGHPFWLSRHERAALRIGQTRPDGNWGTYETSV